MSSRIRTFVARRAVALQIAGVVTAMLVAALYPPTHGRMILVPLWPGAERGMIARALDSKALLVGSGPLPNSFVVLADRSAVIGPMLRRGVAVLAAPPAACGEKKRVA
ncbi:MAG: hypothetical protein ABW023_13695 [Sphingomonas sp.]